MMKPIKKRGGHPSVALLTIYYEGMELRVANCHDDVISSKKQFMGMPFTHKEDKIGQYKIDFPYNKMIDALIRKFQTQKFDTLLQYCKKSNPDKILSHSTQKSTILQLIVEIEIPKEK